MFLEGIYQMPGMMLFGLLLIAVWTTIWKGLALWHSAKNKQLGWFIVILVFNTLGLLPIIYLIWFKPKREVQQETPKKAVKKKQPGKRKRGN